MLKRIVTAAILLPLFLFVLFFLPYWCSAILASLLSAAAAYELLWSTRLVPVKWIVALVMAAATFAPLAFTFRLDPAYAVFLYFLVIAVLFVYGMIRTERFRFSQITAAVFAMVVIPVFFSAFPVILEGDKGRFLIVLPFLTAWGCDTCAYFTGVAFGKHKLIEHISAKKTVEGAIGGIVGSTLLVTGYAFLLRYAFSLKPSFPLFILIGLIGSAVSQIGDLSMSLIKRENHIKDYGNLMPGHGGVLDRFDSVLFVLPIVFAASSLFTLIS
ncbi:MAG: phosphatidate cytidylyltransferase [Clostridia bacterium]|nr:phosphatidate cytidylyltransferase [Clostridia bacterium]